MNPLQDLKPGKLYNAGRQACRLLRKQAAEVSVRHKLLEIENSGAHCCALLALHVCRFDGVPSRNTSASFEEIRQITGIQARLASLIQLQQRIVEQLKEMLPHAGDDRLYSDLRYMLELHQKA